MNFGAVTEVKNMKSGLRSACRVLEEKSCGKSGNKCWITNAKEKLTSWMEKQLESNLWPQLSQRDLPAGLGRRKTEKYPFWMRGNEETDSTVIKWGWQRVNPWVISLISQQSERVHPRRRRDGTIECKSLPYMQSYLRSRYRVCTWKHSLLGGPWHVYWPQWH